MNAKGIGVTAAALVALAVGGLLWLGRVNAPETPPVAPPPMTPDGRADVPGLPPLFPEGMEHAESDISIDEYFTQFGGPGAVDPDTRQIREDVAARIREELVGKQVTWDGYVRRVKDYPSGRVMLILSSKPEQPGLNSAMIQFSAAWRDHIHAYQTGDRVRVIAVYDKMMSVFPSLRGISVEPIPAEG